MNRDDLIKELLLYVKTKSFSVYTLGRTRKWFSKSVTLIDYQIEILEKDGELSGEELQKCKKKICKCLDALRAVVLENPIDSKLSNFIDNYIFIVYNWNNNTINDVKITNIITYLERCIKSKLTVAEASFVLDSIVSKIGRFKGWAPPSFKLSKHFFDLTTDGNDDD